MKVVRLYQFISGTFTRKFFICFLWLFSFQVHAQTDSLSFFEPSPVYNPSRVKLIKYSVSGLYPISMYWLYSQWYKDHEQMEFHTFNDYNEWSQMDKAGHVFTAYTISQVGMRTLKWAGMNSRKSAWYGAGIGFVYQASFEVFDGFSSGWGFSFSDLAANGFGSAVFLGQQFGWNEQRVTLKYSFHQTEFAQFRRNLLGSGLAENFIKDYNGQTYWLCINPRSFMKAESRFPPWLGIALGYGADGLLGGRSNPVVADGKVVPLYDRYRQYYLSLDIDLSKIQTKSKFLSGVFKVINFIKLPAPAIEFNSHHKTTYYAFYF